MLAGQALVGRDGLAARRCGQGAWLAPELRRKRGRDCSARTASTRDWTRSALRRVLLVTLRVLRRPLAPAGAMGSLCRRGRSLGWGIQVAVPRWGGGQGDLRGGPTWGHSARRCLGLGVPSAAEWLGRGSSAGPSGMDLPTGGRIGAGTEDPLDDEAEWGVDVGRHGCRVDEYSE